MPSDPPPKPRPTRPAPPPRMIEQDTGIDAVDAVIFCSMTMGLAIVALAIFLGLSR